MPRVKQHKARTDVYNRGACIPDEKTKSGYRVDRSQPRDETDTIFVKKGETYWQWGMMQGGRGVQHYSKTPPRRSQLTNSDFLGQIYDLEDTLDFSQAASPEDLEGIRDEIVQQLRDLGGEQIGKYDNMPDGLQQGDTGQLLEARAEACEAIADEFDQIDLDDYEELDASELKEINDRIGEELGIEDSDEIERTSEYTFACDEAEKEKLDEWLQEKVTKLESVSWDYE